MKSNISKRTVLVLTIAAIVLVISTSNTKAISLSELYPKEKLGSMLIPRTEWHPFPKAHERKAWTAIPVKLQQNLINLGEEYLDLPAERVSPEVLLQAYLRSLAAECRRLPLGVVDPRFLQTGLETAVSLSEVYVDLDVLSPVQETGHQTESALLARLALGGSVERMPLLEAIAQPQATGRIVAERAIDQPDLPLALRSRPTQFPVADVDNPAALIGLVDRKRADYLRWQGTVQHLAGRNRDLLNNAQTLHP